MTLSPHRKTASKSSTGLGIPRMIGRANKGMLWKDMANIFNKKFNSNGTGKELRARYEEVERALDPQTPDAEKPDWATNKNETFAVIQTSARGRSSGPNWKKGEDQLLDECRNRNMSWEQTAEELSAKIWQQSKPGSSPCTLQKSSQRSQGYKSTLKYKAWTQDEID